MPQDYILRPGLTDMIGMAEGTRINIGQLMVSSATELYNGQGDINQACCIDGHAKLRTFKW